MKPTTGSQEATRSSPYGNRYGQKFDPPARGKSPSSDARSKSPPGASASVRGSSPGGGAIKAPIGASTSAEKPLLFSSTTSSTAKIDEKVDRLMGRTSGGTSNPLPSTSTLVGTGSVGKLSERLNNTFKNDFKTSSTYGSDSAAGSAAKKALAANREPLSVFGSKRDTGSDSKEEFGYKIRDQATEFVSPELGLDHVRSSSGLLGSGFGSGLGSAVTLATTPAGSAKVVAHEKVSLDKPTDDVPDTTEFLASIEDIINARYDPFIDYVKDLTKDVRKATKLLKRDKISNAFGVEREDAFRSIPSSPSPVNNKSQRKGDVRVIICALDYVGSPSPLSCTVDGDNMQELCKASGITDVSVLYNSQANWDAVAAKIKRVGSRCMPGDFFVFYYAGHGTQMVDKDGDELDGYDEAFCLVTPDGKIDKKGFMTDDQFADLVTAAIPEECKVLVLSDCCHSGTVCDFGTSLKWSKFQAVSFSGCKDHQTSGDTGRGGIFTHALCLAIERTRAEGKSFDRIGQFFARVIDVDDEVFDSAQDIFMDSSVNCDKYNFPWPIVPTSYYKAPFKKSR